MTLTCGGAPVGAALASGLRVRLGFAAVDDVRRRVRRDSLGHRGRRDDPLFRVRRLLRRRADRLTDRDSQHSAPATSTSRSGSPGSPPKTS
ncbi:MAG: hypothetical protein ABJA34_13580, partial [Pseudonocardiales bacterium]